MRKGEKLIKNTLKSRGMTWLLIAVSLVMAMLYLAAGAPRSGAPAGVPGGLWLPGPESLGLRGIAGAAVAVAFTGACCFIMAAINKVFNLLRTVSTLFVGLFALMLASTPQFYITPGSGTPLALCVLACIMLLYSIYQEPQRTRRVFLVFFIIAAGTVWEHGFVPYLAVFLVALSQVRCFNGRTLLAALIGIATPLWLLVGFGLIDITSPQVPPASGLYAIASAPSQPATLAAIAAALSAGFLFGIANLAKTISFNARSRAYFGALGLTGIVTGTLCLVDYGNIGAYAPLLFACTAFQAGAFMRLYESRRAYLGILLLIFIFSGIYIWSATA